MYRAVVYLQGLKIPFVLFFYYFVSYYYSWALQAMALGFQNNSSPLILQLHFSRFGKQLWFKECNIFKLCTVASHNCTFYFFWYVIAVIDCSCWSKIHKTFYSFKVILTLFEFSLCYSKNTSNLVLFNRQFMLIKFVWPSLNLWEFDTGSSWVILTIKKNMYISSEHYLLLCCYMYLMFKLWQY